VITLSAPSPNEDVLLQLQGANGAPVPQLSEVETVVFGEPLRSLRQSIAHEDVTNESLVADRADVSVKRKPWTRVVSALFFVVVVAGLYANRSLATSVWGELHRISVRSMLWLGLLLGAHKLSHGVLHAASIPGLRLRRAVLATEAYVGASNSVVGGAGIGTALRIAMYRSWGVTTEGVALSVWATALAPSFAMWVMAGAQTMPRLVFLGHGTSAERFAALASIGFVGVPAIFWTVALRSPKPFAWVAGCVDRTRTNLFSLLNGRAAGGIRASRVGTFAVADSLESLRLRAKTLSPSRRAVLFAAALAGQFLMATILLACVRALGVPSSDVDAFAVYRAFALLRVLSSFLPIPGGLGILDVGLLGVLTAGGVHRPTAIAALALYRGLTFVLPMFTGSLCAAGWRASASCADHRAARKVFRATALATNSGPVHEGVRASGEALSVANGSGVVQAQLAD
jgi:putative heme transporter